VKMMIMNQQVASSSHKYETYVFVLSLKLLDFDEVCVHIVS